MFRSVFTKYISVFMLITVTGFLILTVILCAMLDSYSADAKTQILERTAEVVSATLENSFEASEARDFNRYVYYNRDEIEQLTTALAGYNEDVRIFIIDVSGTVLAHDSGVEVGYLRSAVPADIIETVKLKGAREFTGDLGGAFAKGQVVNISPIRSAQDEFVGAAMACSESHQFNVLMEDMIKTIVLSCLLVMLAMLVAVYFMTERVIDPLKQMSKAAKSFAAGKFDVRVPVSGRDEVAELATAFNSMAASLSQLEDMRRTFLSSVSHDLRTPMTTISGFIDGIIDGAIPKEKHEYYLDVIRNEVRRLGRLVSSLLDITRIQAGERKFNKTAFDICEMARLILISFEQKIDAKHLDVEFDCKSDKMTVWADRDAIYQILYNICDNAVKFSREGGVYRISILEREKKVYISVYNEGEGIPSEELPFVFERFYKSDKSRGLDKTGVGLGLYICKTIIDAHDEEIWVKSVQGKDCEFVFTLPYTPEGEVVVKD